MNAGAAGAGRGLWFDNARVLAALVDGFEIRDHDAITGLASVSFGIAPDGTFAPRLPEGRRIDLAGRILLPTFIDSHVHLDKAYIVQRTGIPAGGLLDAVGLSIADAANWTSEDLEARMNAALGRAYHNGTSALRTHLDTPVLPEESLSWAVFSGLRAHWQGRIALQAVALMALERVEDSADYAERCRQIKAAGGILGAFIAPGTATPERLDRLFGAAGDAGLDVDFHVDETLDPSARGLERICDSILRTGFDGRVMAGHCCSLGTMPHADRDRIIDKAARTGIHVVSLPTSNLFLQDRSPRATPVRRGVTTARELRAAGASVHFASDNVQDPFYPYGDYDMLDVFRTAVQVAHLEADVGTWLARQFDAATQACGLSGHGRLAAGATANAILFEARDLVGLMSRPGADRIVLRGGVPVARPPADLSMLLAPEFR